MTTVSLCEVTLVAAEGLLIKGQGRNTFSITGDLCHYQIDALGSCLSFIRNCTYSISINFHKNPFYFVDFPDIFNSMCCFLLEETEVKECRGQTGIRGKG